MKPPMLTQDELHMVKESILIPLMLYYIHSDIQKIHQAGLRLDLLLANGLEKVQDDILSEHYTVKQQLKERGIKVISQRQTDSGIEAEYLCRGYQHRMALLWDIVNTETLKKVSHYSGFQLTSG